MKIRRREVVVSKDRMLAIYPTLWETKKKGILTRILEKLVLKRR
jgi:hypothetical protein